MRLLYGVGKYIILFKDVLSIFWVLTFVFAFIVAGFAFGFHLLLSNQDYFALMPDAILKTMLMMLGEYDFGDIFLPSADGREVLPFPAPTYAMFIFFFALVSILSLNVLVGLTVEDIRRYLENADLLALSMKLEFTLNVQRWKRKELVVETSIRKPLMTSNSDLLSYVTIWEKIMIKEKAKARNF